MAHDADESAKAAADLAKADSIIAFKEIELEDLKKNFVFEKEEKYQTVGNYVLPQHSGSKTRLSFFPEVEETGKLLFVSIDSKRQYAFVEVDLEKDDYEKLIPHTASSKDREAVEKCVELASVMRDLSSAKKNKGEAERRMKFYEKKKEKMGY